jgi:hypothetical protein
MATNMRNTIKSIVAINARPRNPTPQSTMNITQLRIAYPGLVGRNRQDYPPNPQRLQLFRRRP